MAKSLNIYFQGKHYGRIQYDEHGISIAEVPEEKYRGIIEDLLDELRREDQSDADLWKEIPSRLTGHIYAVEPRGEAENAD